MGAEIEIYRKSRVDGLDMLVSVFENNTVIDDTSAMPYGLWARLKIPIC